MTVADTGWGNPKGRQEIPDGEGEAEMIGSQDKLDFIHAAAAIAAVSERLIDEMHDMATELATTRQFLRITQEDRHRVLGTASEAVQLARATSEDVGVIREVTERLDALVGDLAKRVQGLKLPKWLGSMAE